MPFASREPRKLVNPVEHKSYALFNTGFFGKVGKSWTKSGLRFQDGLGRWEGVGSDRAF